MPRYDYVHNDPNGCDDFETFQKMSEDAFGSCPECGQPVYRKISTVNFKVKGAPFNEGQTFSDHYSHKLNRKVEKHEQFYTVPTQPGGGGGEVINLTGMSSGAKESAIAEAHIRAGDARITSVKDVELLE